MNIKSLLALLDAKPFRPFDIDLVNGRKLRVDHPENLHLFPDRARVTALWVYYPEPEDYSIFFPEGIAALHVRSRKRRNGGR